MDRREFTEQEQEEILNKFAKEFFEGQQDLDGEIVEMVNRKFWKLIESSQETNRKFKEEQEKLK